MKGECSYPGLWKLENISAYSVIIALQINTHLVPADDLSWGCRQDGQESRHLEAWLRLEGLLPTLLPSTLAMSCLRVLRWEPASPTADIWEGPQGGSHRASNDLVWGSCPFSSTVLCWLGHVTKCMHSQREGIGLCDSRHKYQFVGNFCSWDSPSQGPPLPSFHCVTSPGTRIPKTAS